MQLTEKKYWHKVLPIHAIKTIAIPVSILHHKYIAIPAAILKKYCQYYCQYRNTSILTTLVSGQHMHGTKATSTLR